MRATSGCLAALCSVAVVAPAQAAVVRDGPARFEVLTPTLIRMEYAADGRFEDRPTMTATRARLPKARVTTRVSRGWREIRTRRITLRYRRGSGPFGPHNVELLMTMGGRRRAVHPDPRSSSGNLGGWRRALDLLSAAVPLHDGVLSRDGWYMLDDTATVLLTDESPGFAVRPGHAGDYRDEYLFAYGHDYARGLRDLRALTGPAPLLPRSAFGVWFSRYWPYSAGELRTLVGQIRADGVPLDTLSVDTDFKRVAQPIGALIGGTVAGAPGGAFSWNGWEWNGDLFPDPKGFMDWAHGQGLAVTLNIHPSINTNDPAYPATVQRSGGLTTTAGQCLVLQADVAPCGIFDWAKGRQLDAYFALHEPFEQAGADFFWLDWCCDGSHADAPGLTADTWINSRYAARQRARGQRWGAFSRIGGSYLDGAPQDNDAANGGTGIFAEHRYTVQFTGDTCATWDMLAFEAKYSAAAGNVGLPYVSHDIGSFNGVPIGGQCSGQATSFFAAHLPGDIYARWVQLGTFQPLDRLHSNHGDRLPSDYPGAAGDAARRFLKLREALTPYTYLLARRAYDTGLPITGALALSWPEEAGAYSHPSEFSFGPDVVVAPVTSPGDPAPVTVWVPPGTWYDWFTGERFRGPAERQLSVPLDRLPVLVRDGAVIPTQGEADRTAPGAPALTILDVFGSAKGGVTLYDDEGTGFGYERGRFTRTKVTHARSRLNIAAARGSYPGAPARRAFDVRIHSGSATRVVHLGAVSTKRSRTFPLR